MAYIDLQNLTTDSTFLSRMAYAIGKYAAYIVNESAGAPNHVIRLNWATRADADQLAMARQLVPAVIMDSNVIADLGAVSDANLQTATETAANTVLGHPVSYLDLASIAADPLFLKRVTVSVAKFAAYILGEAPTVANHATRYRWAQSAIVNSGGVAAAIASAVVLDSNIQPGLMASTDAQIQAGVEAQIAVLLL